MPEPDDRTNEEVDFLIGGQPFRMRPQRADSQFRAADLGVEAAAAEPYARAPEPQNYHLRVRNFHPRTLRATDRLFRSRPWSGTEEKRTDRFERWLRRVSRAYCMPTPELRIVEGSFAHYDPLAQRIVLPYHSVLTLMHEFRHHMQTLERTDRSGEVDARAWSQSLFFQARPELYERAVAAGRILYP